MTWYRFTLTREQTTIEPHKILKDFMDIALATPKAQLRNAAVLTELTTGGDGFMDVFISPEMAVLSAETIKVYGATPCEAPKRRRSAVGPFEIGLLAGDRSVLGSLEETE